MSGFARMEDWALLGGPDTGLFLQGKVYGHPDHGDGRVITTPVIVRRYLEEGVPMYVAKNRAIFQLGKPNEEYEEDFPGSMQRIIGEIQAGQALPGPVAPLPKDSDVIIEEKPAPRPAAQPGAGEPSDRAGVPFRAILRPEPTPGVTAPALAAPAETLAARPLTRSTDKLPDCALFYWRPVYEDEKTDLERDNEAFEVEWAAAGADVVESQKDTLRRIFLKGCATARARKSSQ